MFDYEVLKLIWWALIGVLLIGLAITDGMDMGVGMLLPFLGKSDEERRSIINTVGSHWDGNQVWLITAGGAIFAAWPMVYAAAFSGFYFAMLLVLFALFLRPLAFDYRSKLPNAGWRKNWDRGLFIGSAVPAFVFGVAFGNLLQGVPFHLDDLMRPTYTGSFWALLNPFALLAGVVSVAMLVMHGAVWLQLRADDAVAARARRMVIGAAAVFVVAFALAGLWVSFGIDGFRIVFQPDIGAAPDPLAKEVEIVSGAWLGNYVTYPWTLGFPALAFIGAVLSVVLSRAKRAGLGFVASSFGLAGVIMTAGVSMFPFLMPSSSNPRSSLTAWDATSSQMTLGIMFWVAVVFVPIILLYTSWCYARMWRRVSVAEIRESATSLY